MAMNKSTDPGKMAYSNRNTLAKFVPLLRYAVCSVAFLDRIKSSLFCVLLHVSVAAHDMHTAIANKVITVISCALE